MRSPWFPGAAAGFAAAVASGLGNVMVGDRHRISTMPDVVTGLAAILIIGIGARRAMRVHPANTRRAGLRAAAGAAISFGLSMGVFGWSYLANHPLDIALVGTIANAVFALVIGLLHVRVAAAPADATL